MPFVIIALLLFGTFKEAEAAPKLESSPPDLPVGVRIARKIVLGTAMGAVLTGVSIYVQGQTSGHSDDPFDGIGFLINGIGVGCSVGFPLGVTLADPHDSFSKTMLGVSCREPSAFSSISPQKIPEHCYCFRI